VDETPFFIGKYLITPHPAAPHFATPELARQYLSQTISEFQSGNFNKEGVLLIRELGFVSLFFFINAILRPTGIYDGLEDDLSLDMCNYRQSSYCMAPGAQTAAFMPRGFSKSRVFNHGGGTWDLLRNPNQNMVIVNAIYDKALEFLHIVQRNFDSNEVLDLFYPEYNPRKNPGGQVTDKLLLLPNKLSKGEVSAKVLGLTGAAEGGHYDITIMDDLVGLDALDQNKQSTAQMGTARKWFNTNKNALRKTQRSRIIVVATRYAVDDCYADIYSSCRTVTGWQHGDLQPVPNGEWDVYYRLVEENGVYLRPDVMSPERLAKLLKDDAWTAMTQYYNSPTKTGLAEFVDSEIRRCTLVLDNKTGRIWIRQDDPNLLDTDSDAETEVALDSCYVYVTTDLAATETGISAKTCRSAILVWAIDGHDNKYLLWSRVGYFDIFTSIDYIFEANRIFAGYVRTTLVESNAFQKIMKPILEREKERRKQYINITTINAKGDKKARIRVAFGTAFMLRQIFATADACAPLEEEKNLFPMSDTKLDTLDASEKAFTYGSRPETTEERERRQYEEELEQFSMRLSCTGY